MEKISNDLEGIIAQMLKPLEKLPFNLVIEGLSKYSVILFDKDNKYDKKNLETLIKTANNVLIEVNKNGILRPPPNEIGNDIEDFVKKSLEKFGYKANTPATLSGKKKSMGYPDIEFIDEFNQHNYLECKTYNARNINTTQRSFFISPSANFKVTKNAHHFGVSFEMFVEKTIKNKRLYKVSNWKILDLGKLKLDIKYEFNANNKTLYDDTVVIAVSDKI